MSWLSYVLTLLIVVASTAFVLLVGMSFNPDGHWMQALWGQLAPSLPGWLVYVIVAVVAARHRRRLPRAAGLVLVGVVGLLVTSVIRSLLWVWIVGSYSMDLISGGGVPQALIYGIPIVVNQAFWLLIVMAVFADRGEGRLKRGIGAVSAEGQPNESLPDGRLAEADQIDMHDEP
jgi:hypothetical protein